MLNNHHAQTHTERSLQQNIVWMYSHPLWQARLSYLDRALLWETSPTERVPVTAQTCNPASLCFADQRQIVYTHTFRQRKSMSLDSTAGSVTQGRLTDRYEPANDNVCVNASARCCILPYKAILAILPSNYICILCFLSVHSLQQAYNKG